MRIQRARCSRTASVRSSGAAEEVAGSAVPCGEQAGM